MFTIPWRRTAAVDPDTEYLLMASHLPLRSIGQVPWFLGLTASVVRQLERTDGLVGYSLRAQPFARSFWTLSGLDRLRSAHRVRPEMPTRASWSSCARTSGPTRFTTWTAAGSALPMPWQVAIEHLDSPSARDRATPRPRTSRPTTNPHNPIRSKHHDSVRRLVAAFAVSYLVLRHGRHRDAARWAMAVAMVFAGVSHFADPASFVRMLPDTCPSGTA